MKWFWLYFFAFLAFLLLVVGLFRPDLLDATLIFMGLFLSAVAYVTLAALAAGVFIGGGLIAWWWYRRTTVESLRQRDGHYPIQRVRVKGGRVVFVDPNQTIGPALMVDRNTGEIYEHEPAAGWHIQATIRGMVEQTRRTQAMFQGDASRSTEWGSQSKGERITAPAARLAAGGYDSRKPAIASNTPRTIETTPAPQMALPAPVRTVKEGFNNNTNTRLVLGQTSDGQLVFWDMMQTPHLRFHGKTQGSGKTNALQTVAAGAARTGAHVIVLDRRRFKDWQEFSGVAELVDTADPRRFAAAVRALCDIYQERDRLLGQHGAPNITRLPHYLQRIVAVVSEFGALCDVAQADGVLQDVLGPLSLIMREAGAAGVHVLLEDQVVTDKWPRGISTNAEPVTGYLPLNYGAAGGYHYAHKLPAYSFHYAGAVFKTWHMQPELRGLLAAAPDLGEPLVSVDSVPRSTVPGADRGGNRAVLSVPPENGTQERNAGTGPGPDDPGRWDDVVATWFAAHPAALTGPAQGISDLARAMCRDNERGNDANYEAYKGRAHKLFHEFRAAARLPNGDKLGVDITGDA